jgi:hypothetical protein
MRRMMMILATALLASSLLTAAAEARASGSVGHMGSVGAAGQIGGFGGAHLGSIDRIEGLGRVHVDGMAGGDRGLGFAHHAMHRGFRAGSGIDESYAPNCYYPAELPKYPPWPPYCS